MKTRILIGVMLLVCTHMTNAQENNPQNSAEGFLENQLSKNSSFHLGNNIEGLIYNTVNESTGKVVFSVPIASISASSAVQYSLALNYDGKSAFETAKNTNEFNPTSCVGVGFSMSVPKIVTDYKQTTTKDDDDYYLIFGNTHKLKCIKRTPELMEFVSEPYNAWKISYHISLEYWIVIKEDGIVYQFGVDSVANGIKKISTWGNWIGDSVQTPTGNMPIEWYLVRIHDQWGNELNFTYDKIEGKQNSNQIRNFHTEALYLKEIRASNGSKLVLSYKNKLPDEYFEPHIEQIEPDAYQERYEKKYIDKVQQFNSSSELQTTTEMNYEIIGEEQPIPYHLKRYLKQIIVRNTENLSLPPFEFKYHTSGEFKGGIYKTTYPGGGFVTYSYEKQNLFTNTMINHTDLIQSIGDEEPVEYGLENDYLVLYTEQSVIHEYWENNTWKESQHFLHKNSGWEFRANKFHGYFSYEPDSRNLILYHLSQNGKTWKATVFDNLKEEWIDTESNLEFHSYELLIGDEFVAFGYENTGDLHIYTLENDAWTYKKIVFSESDSSNASAKYSFTAFKNYILAINVKGGEEIEGSNTIDYQDNFYINYLNNEKNWISKSWSKEAVRFISNLPDSYQPVVVPNNSMALLKMSTSLTLGSDSYYLHWDDAFNLIKVHDNIIVKSMHREIGSTTLSDLEFYANSNSGFVFRLYRYFGLNRYDGINWSFGPYSDATNGQGNYTRVSSVHGYHIEISPDRLVLENGFNCSGELFRYIEYLPNKNSWKSSIIDGGIENGCSPFLASFDNYIFKNEGVYKKIDTSDGLEIRKENSDNFTPFNSRKKREFSYKFGYNNDVYSTRLYYIDKSTGQLEFSELELRNDYVLKNKQFSNNAILSPTEGRDIDGVVCRLVQGGFQNEVYDIVVKSIELNDLRQSPRKIEYQYEEKNMLSDERIFYGKTTIEHKGFGNDSKGKIIKFFDTGLSDMRLLGTLNRIENRDVNGELKKEATFTYDVFSKYTANAADKPVLSTFIRNTDVTDTTFLESGTLTVNTVKEYNAIGLPVRTTTIKSDGSTEELITDYGFENSSASLATPFLERNMLSQTIEERAYNNGVLSSRNQIKWKAQNDILYPYQNWTGVSQIKRTNEITKISDTGVIIEEKTGTEVYKVILMGYDSKYPVAGIGNARYEAVMLALGVSYENLQTMHTESLKNILLKLYESLPKATISLTFYDSNGNITNRVDARKEEMFYYYDAFNRIVYTTDALGNKLNESEYHYKS